MYSRFCSGFPDWCGASWDAFWDCIIAIVEMPE
ncbi:barstar family protein [Hymenobacter tibetensis]